MWPISYTQVPRLIYIKMCNCASAQQYLLIGSLSVNARLPAVT